MRVCVKIMVGSKGLAVSGEYETTNNLVTPVVAEMEELFFELQMKINRAVYCETGERVKIPDSLAVRRVNELFYRNNKKNEAK